MQNNFISKFLKRTDCTYNVENPRKLSPSRYGKLTPFRHFKLTPLFRLKLNRG